jgi:hypothetical protein
MGVHESEMGARSLHILECYVVKPQRASSTKRSTTKLLARQLADDRCRAERARRQRLSLITAVHRDSRRKELEIV